MHVKHFFKPPGTIVLVAVIFGIAVAVFKGGDAGVRDSIGNISAPWLLLPYFAGTRAGGPVRGALMGAAASLAALLGFYVAEAFVLDLGGHPLLTNLTLTLGAGRLYLVAGLLSGPLFGGLAGTRTRHGRIVTALVVGVALVGEPIAVFAWLAHEGMAPSDTGLVVQYPALWLGEAALGVLLGAGLLASRRLGQTTAPLRLRR